jgi:hypothetical protein
MIHRIPASFAAGSTRMPARTIAPVNGRALSALALAGLLLVGCVTSGDGPSPTAGEANVLPKLDPAAAKDAASGPEAGPRGAASLDPILLQRRRQVIAEMIESLPSLHTLYLGEIDQCKVGGTL